MYLQQIGFNLSCNDVGDQTRVGKKITIFQQPAEIEIRFFILFENLYFCTKVLLNF